MVISRSCKGHKQDGSACGAAPLLDEDFCYMHSPAHAEEAAAARRTGGLRRRRESTIAVAYDLAGIGNVEAIQRVVEIVIFDALGMENTVARGRLPLAASQTAAKLLEVGELAERLTHVEAALGPRLLARRPRR